MPDSRPDIRRRAAAEALGTALLLAAIVGSGIMAERLAGGQAAVALLANTLASAAALGVLIFIFAPVSGAHFNPVVTLADAFAGGAAWRDVPAYLTGQVAGAFLGTAAAHLMFGEPLFAFSQHARSGPAQMLSELIATFGLLIVIRGSSRRHPSSVPIAVAAYIASAYWFTASTSFANPAVTLARAVTDTFSGIRPHDVPGFLAAQLCGAAAATVLCGWLLPAEAHSARPASIPRRVS